jgi:hypothetical protein
MIGYNVFKDFDQIFICRLCKTISLGIIFGCIFDFYIIFKENSFNFSDEKYFALSNTRD